MSRRDEPRDAYPKAPAHRRQGRTLREVAVPLDAPPQLQSLAAIERELRAMETRRGEAIANARAAGASWDQVAAVLGISRQAAWERFRDYAMALLDETARNATQTEDEAYANAEAVLRDVRAQRTNG
jgi:hypothetical protein